MLSASATPVDQMAVTASSRHSGVGAWVLRTGALAAIALSVLVLLLATGHDASAALSALARGAFGSWYAITSATLVRAVPFDAIELELGALWAR